MMSLVRRRAASRCVPVLFLLGGMLPAQQDAAADAPPPMPEVLLEPLEWRQIGPFRGGRACAVAGHPRDKDTYWMGSSGGGVWQTTDGGETWENRSDGFFGGSVGSVAVAPSNPDVVYVGLGENTVRGNMSHGDGVWRTTDGGETWDFLGLPESRQVPRIRIHPKNPDVAYAAVLGSVYGPNPNRGVYRTKDGGETWELVLKGTDSAGAFELVMDAKDPDVLYASLWRIRRNAWVLESGGEGSSLWKSTDGGDTWENLSEKKGMPKGTLGIIGIAVSPADTDRVWAMVENQDGGLFRSDDAGETWELVNDDRNLRQRAWYYSRIYADPKGRNTVYALNVQMWKSTDGGREFSRMRTGHSDNHDLWIDPRDPNRMAEANDGGAQVSTNGGRSWSTLGNQPTAQFYRVTTDNEPIYRIYGAQQDNSTVRIRHRGLRGRITEDDWESTAGGESGHIAPHPEDPEVVYGGSYGGYLERRNHRLGTSRTVNVWPDNPLGGAISDVRYRFQWNFPIFFSPHDPGTLYTAAQVLFRSRDDGHSWEPISPDLTTNDLEKQASSGGPITKDNTGVEVFCTIFAACESPLQKGVLWAGSDDGLVHVSADDGATWTNVTPEGIPPFTTINSVEPHPTNPQGLYLAATGYRQDDFTPYLFATEDLGQTWRRIDAGIDRQHFTRVIRADATRAGLLYAGTERGVYVSFDDGARWQPLQQNLPVTPVTDMAVKGNDLIAATQGRAFWVLDNLDHLRQLNPGLADSAVILPVPEPAVQLPGRRGRNPDEPSLTNGMNPRGNVQVWFHIAENLDPTEVEVEFLRDGKVVYELESEEEEEQDGSEDEDGDEDDEDEDDEADDEEEMEGSFKLQVGWNRVSWDMSTKNALRVEGMVLWGAQLGGPDLPPGRYTVRLTVESVNDELISEVPLQVVPDPRDSCPPEDLVARYDFLAQIRDQLTEVHQTVLDIRRIRGQVETVLERAGDDAADGLKEAGKALVDGLTEVEEALHQTKAKSSQDVLNFPIRLNNKLANVASGASRSRARPTAGMVAVHRELTAKIDVQLKRFRQLATDDVKAFDRMAREAAVPYVQGIDSDD